MKHKHNFPCLLDIDIFKSDECNSTFQPYIEAQDMTRQIQDYIGVNRLYSISRKRLRTYVMRTNENQR